MTDAKPKPTACLALADGTIFYGKGFGTTGQRIAELCFNTAMTGYQEIMTDPSYAGQIVTFTFPHIGNVGVNPEDDETADPVAEGLVVKWDPTEPSNWRAAGELGGWLARTGRIGIGGIDTRRLTRHIREAGSMPGAFGAADETTLKQAVLDEPGTDGQDLATVVSCTEPYTVGDGPRRVVAYDLGIKTTILRHLGDLATVEVVPAGTPADLVLAREPDGVFLSNGPGDPAAVTETTEAIRSLLGQVPIFGICLGHQLLATALGGSTEKLPFGHHGGNHPVKRLATGGIEITSQNHNYAVAADSLDAAEVTHVNLNDGVIEGLASADVPAFGVQYHPEAGPGPHDARYLFDLFADLMDQH